MDTRTPADGSGALPDQAIRLLVVDDHTLFRRGLVALLSIEPGFEIVGEAADASEALRRARELQPELILLDNHMPGVHGVAAIEGLLEAAPQARIIMLTVSEDEDDLAAALRAGAHGYVLKTIDGDELASMIRRTMQGESVISPEMTGKLVAAFRSGAADERTTAPVDPLATLSPREYEILTHIARGASNKMIARDLDIAETTVKIHVQNLLRKLGLNSRVQAAVFLTERQAER